MVGSGRSILALAKTPTNLGITKFNRKKKLLAAICAAPTILAKMGVLQDRKATVYPGLEKSIPYPRGDKVVVDGKIITSQGPGTAIEFALSIVEALVGKGKAGAIRNSLVA